MKLKKVGLQLLFFLVFYWIAAIFIIIFVIGIGVAFIFYLKTDNSFYFDWINESIYALNRAVPGGGVLGIGIWIKARLQEKKDLPN